MEKISDALDNMPIEGVPDEDVKHHMSILSQAKAEKRFTAQGYDNPPYFRLRIGDMRALFIKDDVRMEIFVFDIDSRGDIYKKNCLHEEKNTYSA